MKEFLKLNYLVTTFFGTGYFPKFPGTFASVVAIIPLLFIPIEWRFISVFSAVVLLSIFSLPLIASVEKEKGNDSSIIVIDEVIGVWLIFCSPFIPLTWFYILVGIILFRIFDILKPSIIGKINEKQGAVFVILDDVCAAIITTILLHFLIFLLKFVVFFKFLQFF